MENPHYEFAEPGRVYHLSRGAMSLLAEPAEAIANTAVFELGLASTRSVGAGALADWTLDKRDDDVDLVAFLAALDLLCWSAAAALHE
jgi:hypothetical protein